MSADGRSRVVKWVVLVVAGVALLAVGVPYVYIHFIQGPAPAKLAIKSTAAPGAALATEDIDGTWHIGAGSQAGYRVKEVLAGQDNTAVGRGTGVTGTLEIEGAQVTKASFVVALNTVMSDSGQRDGQFTGRIMDTAQFPDATFTLTKPISLGSIPKVNQTISVKASGTLTMHGVTKPVVASMTAEDTGSAIDISGEIPVVFANWNIANPSFGSFVKTEDDGLVEFLLKTTKTSP